MRNSLVGENMASLVHDSPDSLGKSTFLLNEYITSAVVLLFLLSHAECISLLSLHLLNNCSTVICFVLLSPCLLQLLSCLWQPDNLSLLQEQLHVASSSFNSFHLLFFQKKHSFTFLMLMDLFYVMLVSRVVRIVGSRFHETPESERLSKKSLSLSLSWKTFHLVCLWHDCVIDSRAEEFAITSLSTETLFVTPWLKVSLSSFHLISRVGVSNDKLHSTSPKRETIKFQYQVNPR
jgi:hypothetical protein